MGDESGGCVEGGEAETETEEDEGAGAVEVECHWVWEGGFWGEIGVQMVAVAGMESCTKVHELVRRAGAANDDVANAVG